MPANKKRKELPYLDNGLTDKTIKHVDNEGVFYTDGTRVALPLKLFDRDRLFLLVTKAGTKRWGWAYRLHGDEKVLALGVYPAVSIKDARKMQQAAAALVANGQNPESKKDKQVQALAAKATAFGGIAQEWINANKSWTPYYRQQVQNFMGRYVITRPIGKKPIREVTRPEIVGLVRDVANGAIKTQGARGTALERKNGSPSIAILLKQWRSAVFGYAADDGRTDFNPIADLKASRHANKPKVKNNRALSKNELETLFAKLTAYRGARTTTILIELLALTFVRTGELRQAQWREFDLETKLWTIPEARMKMKDRGDHLVPLCPQAIELLKELRSLTGVPLSGPDWLFRNQRRPETCATATTVNRALENMGFNGHNTIGFSAHGFRGTASTLLHELRFRPEVIETQLAHLEKSMVKRAYNKAKHLDDRVAMMNAWGRYIDARKGKGPQSAINDNQYQQEESANA